MNNMCLMAKFHLENEKSKKKTTKTTSRCDDCSVKYSEYRAIWKVFCSPPT